MIKYLKLLLKELENNKIDLKENKTKIIFSLKMAIEIIEILDKIRRG